MSIAAIYKDPLDYARQQVEAKAKKALEEQVSRGEIVLHAKSREEIYTITMPGFHPYLVTDYDCYWVAQGALYAKKDRIIYMMSIHKGKPRWRIIGKERDKNGIKWGRLGRSILLLTAFGVLLKFCWGLMVSGFNVLPPVVLGFLKIFAGVVLGAVAIGLFFWIYYHNYTKDADEPSNKE